MGEIYENSQSSLDKLFYNPDGSMKPLERQRLLKKGHSLSLIDRLEKIKMDEVQRFEERELKYLKDCGVSIDKWLEEQNTSSLELEERQRKAIHNGEEISSLPMAVEPDEYYEELGF